MSETRSIQPTRAQQGAFSVLWRACSAISFPQCTDRFVRFMIALVAVTATLWGCSADKNQPSGIGGSSAGGSASSTHGGNDAIGGAAGNTAGGDAASADATTKCVDAGCSKAVATAISTGFSHACAVLKEGSIVCWGDNSYGQLGIGTIAPIIDTAALDGSILDTLDGSVINVVTPGSGVPVQVSGISDAVQVAAGGLHTCARLGNGSVKCWGDNAYGQLGDGTHLNSSDVPVNVSGITSATVVAAGSHHTCALLSNGSIQCWGCNESGQLGNGTITEDGTLPVAVSGITDATAIVAGGNYSCDVSGGGSIQCWGLNGRGEFGNGNTTSSSVPVIAASGISDATMLSPAVDGWACAVLSRGTIECWGYCGCYPTYVPSNPDASVPPDNNIVATPQLISGITSAIGVTSGDYSLCALLGNGTVQCWGSGQYGQLGNGSNMNSDVPVTVSGISTAGAISGIGDFVCALLGGGSVQCWGANGSGQLGNGATTDSNVPVTVSGF
jgi:hypothetical protein